VRILTALLVATLVQAVLSRPALAKTSNGNDFALYYIECKTDVERKELLDDAKKRPHFFRYLQIMYMEESAVERGTHISITAFEPASYMDVQFVVKKRYSIDKLKEEPESKQGDAIAVTGVVRGVKENTIILDPVVVRHKDRLHPKRGKELLCEVDPGATFYSYTGGKRAVSLTYKDRDLLQHKDRVLSAKGNVGWQEFLEQELAKRKKSRAAEAAARKKKP
jgi:hypothetical protein